MKIIQNNLLRALGFIIVCGIILIGTSIWRLVKPTIVKKDVLR